MLFFILIILTVLIIHRVYIHYQRLEKRKRSLAGKVVLITGSGNGLGQELCLAFAREQCHIICVDIDKTANDETVKQIKTISDTIKVSSYNLDVTNFEEVQELGRNVHADFKSGIDILINNAGVIHCARLLDQDQKTILKQMNVNVNAHFWTIQTFLPKMLEKNSGNIVGISSIAGKIPFEGVVPYCTSKYAVIGLMESLTVELLSMKTNVKTLTICPGFMATKLLPQPYCNPGLMWVNNIPIVVVKPKSVARRIVLAMKEERRLYFNQIVYPILISITNILPQCIREWFQGNYLVTTPHVLKSDDSQKKSK